MLIAAREKQLVDAKNAGRGRSYVCPACQQQVVLHHGTRVQPYFAHRPQSPCTVKGEGETAQHVLGKRQLAEFFAPWGAITLERILPSIAQRADCWIAHQPRPIALEFQCSPINRDEVAERTRGYQGLGVYPLWLLGSRFAKQKLGWHLIDRFASWLNGWGLCLLFWDVDRHQLRVDHHICQAITGEYQCQSVWLTNVTDLSAGSQRRLWWAQPNLARFRWELDRDLHRSSTALKPLQTAVYLTGHHLAGFPQVLATVTVTAPIFGRGLLLWRIILAAWLFERSNVLTDTLERLAWTAFQLVGGEVTAVRFTGQTAYLTAIDDLLADLTQADLIKRTTTGWQVISEPHWDADYTAWLENDEKILG
ncbi:competence protein CoiA [Levilactobacillus lanxiensis]|uniref:Competence protein CoiA n=1 Tax=Levilactobacillus lanxiensis TaxID=2799568 RepID=A0ABW4D2V4_9LACO|nr:competence protein CoiA family protein [Levilactobacillus lanxiensis]